MTLICFGAQIDTNGQIIPTQIFLALFPRKSVVIPAQAGIQSESIKYLN